MEPNQRKCLNRGLSLNFWWLGSANNMKFTEKCDVYGETYFSFKKCLQKN